MQVMESIRSGLLLAQGKGKEEEGKLATLESLKHLEDERRGK